MIEVSEDAKRERERIVKLLRVLSGKSFDPEILHFVEHAVAVIEGKA